MKLRSIIKQSSPIPTAGLSALMGSSTSDLTPTGAGFALQLHEAVDQLVHLTAQEHDANTDALLGPGHGRLNLDDDKITHVLNAVNVPENQRYCALSPPAEVTLDDKEARRRYSIHEKATHFAFVYPVAELEGIYFSELEQIAHKIGLHRSLLYLLIIGGFAYFDKKSGTGLHLVQVNALSLCPSRTKLYFEGPIEIESETVRNLDKQGRMASVMLHAFEAVGKDDVCWVNPAEPLVGVDQKRMLAENPWAEGLYEGDECPWIDGAFVFSSNSNEHGERTCVMYRLVRRKPDRDLETFSPFEQITRASTKGTQAVEDVLGEFRRTHVLANIEAHWRLIKQHTGDTAFQMAVAGARRQQELKDMELESGQLARSRLGRHARTQELDMILSEENKATPIMWAAKGGLSDAVQNLLDAGATPSITAIELALDHANKAAAFALLGHRECHWMSSVQVSEDQAAKSGSSLDMFGQLALDSRLLMFDILAELANEDTFYLPKQVVRMEKDHGQEKALLMCMRVMEQANYLDRTLVESDPVRADELRVVSWQAQLCAAALLTLKSETTIDQMLCNDGAGNQALSLALRREAKVFLAQPVVCQFVRRIWRGNFKFTPRCVLRLLFQIPLLLPMAVCPHVSFIRSFKRLTGLSTDLLRAPIICFWICFVFDIAFAMQLSFASRSLLERHAYLVCLLIWAAASFLWEMRQLTEAAMGLRVFNLERLLHEYCTDRFNKVDMPAALLSASALGCIYWDLHVINAPDYRSTTRMVRSAAVLFLWLRVPRLFLLLKQSGPLILIFFHMIDNVMHFLVLLASIIVSFAAAYLVNFEPKAAVEDFEDWPWGWNTIDSLGEDCEAHFSGIVTTLRFLLEAALSGNEFFRCGLSSSSDTASAVYAWGLTISFFTLTSLLLLNMLIAMMTKSFESVADAQAINYQLLVAQSTFSILDNANLPPPPLNVLTIPYNAYNATGWMLNRCASAPQVAAPKPPIAKATRTVVMKASSNSVRDTDNSSTPSSTPRPMLKSLGSHSCTSSSGGKRVRINDGDSEGELSRESSRTATRKKTSIMSPNKVVQEKVFQSIRKIHNIAFRPAEVQKLLDAVQEGEKAERSMFVLREIEKYVREGMDCVFQEERWRTSLTKEVKKTRREMKSRYDAMERDLEVLRKEVHKETVANGMWEKILPQTLTTTVAAHSGGRNDLSTSKVETFDNNS